MYFKIANSKGNKYLQLVNKQQFSPRTRFVIGFNEALREQKFSDFQSFLEHLRELKEVSDSKVKVISYLAKKRLKRFFSVSLEETNAHYRLVVR